MTRTSGAGADRNVSAMATLLRTKLAGLSQRIGATRSSGGAALFRELLVEGLSLSDFLAGVGPVERARLGAPAGARGGDGRDGRVSVLGRVRRGAVGSLPFSVARLNGVASVAGHGDVAIRRASILRMLRVCVL